MPFYLCSATQIVQELSEDRSAWHESKKWISHNSGFCLVVYFFQPSSVAFFCSKMYFFFPAEIHKFY